MGLKKLKKYYEKFTSKDAKRSLNIDLFEIMSIENFESSKFGYLTERYFILYEVCKEKDIFNKERLEEYKTKYFDTVKDLVKKLK